jgi:hypothetical protein
MALRIFVDNVFRQVIECHLLRFLPVIFCPEGVAIYKDEDLERVAAKAPENIKQRKRLRDLHKKLECSLINLRR